MSKSLEVTARPPITFYETSLRDGAQHQDVTFTPDGKLRAIEVISKTGVHIIEIGWPGAIETDTKVSQMLQDRPPIPRVKLAAFGSTRRPNVYVENDDALVPLIAAKTDIVTIVGKSDLEQVTKYLKTTDGNNLRMIEETTRYLLSEGVPEVGFDAEHYFDGFLHNPEYALETLRAAVRGGASWVTLCDTKGGALMYEIRAGVRAAVQDKELQNIPIGIHTHNDFELAVANSFVAIEEGVTQVQGTLIGIGERIGNANLSTIMLVRTLKQHTHEIPPDVLPRMKSITDELFSLAGLPQNPYLPFLGNHAHAHKAGLHTVTFKTDSVGYENFPPEVVGNRRRFVISEQMGKGGAQLKLEQLEFPYEVTSEFLSNLVSAVKHNAFEGYRYDRADASFDMLARRLHEGYTPPYSLRMYKENGKNIAVLSTDMRKEQTGQAEILHLIHQPDQIFKSLKRHLANHFPQLKDVLLLNQNIQSENSITRVFITATNGWETWTTVSAGHDKTQTALNAVNDALEYAYWHPKSSSQQSAIQ